MKRAHSSLLVFAVALALGAAAPLRAETSGEDKHDLFIARPTVAYGGFLLQNHCGRVLAHLSTTAGRKQATMALAMAATMLAGQQLFFTKNGQALRGSLSPSAENQDFLLQNTDSWLLRREVRRTLRNAVGDSRRALHQNLLERLKDPSAPDRLRTLEHIAEFLDEKDEALEARLLEQLESKLASHTLSYKEADATWRALEQVGGAASARAALTGLGRGDEMNKLFQDNGRWWSPYLQDRHFLPLLADPLDALSVRAAKEIGYTNNAYEERDTALDALKRGNPYAAEVLMEIGVRSESNEELYGALFRIRVNQLKKDSFFARNLRTHWLERAIQDWKDNTPESRQRAIAFFHLFPEFTPDTLTPEERDADRRAEAEK